MKARSMLLSVLSVVLCVPAMADDVTISKGSGTRVPVPEGIRRVVVANPSVLDARPSEDGKSVLINGITEGTSEVRIERLQGGDLVHRVSVRSDLQGMLAEIKELLSDVEGLDAKVIGDKVVLKGSILTKSGYDKVMKVVEAYQGVILNMAKLDRTEMNKFVEAAIVRDIGMDTVKVRVMEDTVLLEGIVFSEADMARAIEMAKLRVPNVKNLMRVQEVMIETDVQFVQVNTDSSTDMGYNVLKSLSVTAGGAGEGGTGTKPSWGFGLSGSVTAKINALVGSGNGKILAQPHLSTKSGGEGTFQSGGTTYFSVSGSVGGSLEKVDYGVILKVKPTLQGKDRIINEVTIEVSVPTAKSQGQFSLDKFQTKSMAMCKTGESVVLSGLVQTLSTRFKEKTPLLGDIPLLSLFFSEKTGKSEKKELVVLITPVPVFPQASTTAPLSTTTEKLIEK